jgi:hypothetical protein
MYGVSCPKVVTTAKISASKSAGVEAAFRTGFGRERTLSSGLGRIAGLTGGTAMSELVLGYLDVTKLAVASFLARYREPTLGSYRVDLLNFPS